MRGLNLFNFPAFEAAAADLRSRGYTVFSPAEHDLETGFDPTTNSLDGFDLTDAMRWDLSKVLESDVVVMLPGWYPSIGSNIEVATARAIGTPVLDYPSLEPAKDEAVTAEAGRIVIGARQATYGHPFLDFSRTAKMWEGVFDHDISPEQVALCMVLVKVGRLCQTPDHRDSVVDIAGYAEALHLVQQYRKGTR
jgi:hypothetical protein